MSLAYLLNCYPQPSQTALRREVAALEEMGVSIPPVLAAAIRGGVGRRERPGREGRTRSVLDVGAPGSWQRS